MESTIALAAPDLPSLAPQTTDNDTVILWALGMAVFGAAFAINKLWNMMASTQVELRAAKDKCAAEYQDLQDKYLEHIQGAQAHAVDMSAKMIRALDRNGDFLEKNLIAQEETVAFMRRHADTDRYEKHK